MSKTKTFWGILVFVVLVLVGGVFYITYHSQPAESDNAIAVVVPVPVVGGQVGDFKALSIEKNKYGDNNVTYNIQYVGTTTISGYFYSDEVLGGAICFNVSAKSEGKIPRVTGDQRDPWFCFSNPTQLPASAASIDNEVTIEVSNYYENGRATETADSAVFDRLIK